MLLATLCAGHALGAFAGPTGDPMSDAPLQTLPVRTTLGFERLRLQGDESLGLLGASYVAELTPGWWLGPALYGAATGRRGGLFTWGAEGQRRWRPANRWELVTGVYVGGGGGANAPVGGGLMLRPHADLMFDFGGWSGGVSASQVRFPSGTLQSTQLGWVVAVHDDLVFTPPGPSGRKVAFGGAGSPGSDRLNVLAGRYGSGAGNVASFATTGVRLDRVINPVWWGTVEASGAATGSADGYAEVLAGALALWPIGNESFRAGARAALGLGGGGSVATGGGSIAKLAMLGRVRVTDTLSVEMEAGRARAFSGAFNTNIAQLSLGMMLGGAASGSTRTTVHDTEWSISVQDYARAQRKDGSARGLSAIGLKFRRQVNDYLYLSGQAHSAITGGAGAYSAGLMGPGTTTRIASSPHWSVGAEALLGAAGGGGVATRGGIVVQPMLWIGHDLGVFSRIKAGAGYLKSLRADLSTPVFDLTWAVAFGGP